MLILSVVDVETDVRVSPAFVVWKSAELDIAGRSQQFPEARL